MALKKRKKPKPKLAEDPKVQAVKDFVARGQAAQHAVDEIVGVRVPVGGGAAIKTGRSTGPSKTQVCDAIRAGQPGLPFAAVDRIAAEVMKLYSR